MSNIWIGQRIVYKGKTGTVRDTFYQGDAFNIDDDILMLEVQMDASGDLILLAVDSVTIVGLEELEDG